MTTTTRYRGVHRGLDRPRPEVHQHYRRWTPREDERLVMLWGTTTLATIARGLGRTQITVYDRARKLKLTCGVPRGMECLSAAAERCGFTTWQIRRVLKSAKVKLHLAMARPRKRKTRKRFHFVDPIDVDAAVATWIGQETLHAAARRLGSTDEIVRRAVLAAGHKPPKSPKLHWRLPSAAIEAALAAWRPGLSVSGHAARVNLSRNTLAKRLRIAGILGEKHPGQGGEVRLSNEQVDEALLRVGRNGRTARRRRPPPAT